MFSDIEKGFSSQVSSSKVEGKMVWNVNICMYVSRLRVTSYLGNEEEEKITVKVRYQDALD